MKKLNKKQLQKLRSESKNWTSKEWEEYLQTIEHQRSESLIHPKKYEELKEENPFLFKNHEKNNLNYELILKLKKALETLTFKQKKVIKMLFWDNFTESEIAKKLGKSRSSIRNTKTQGLQRLKLKLGTLSPYIEGKSLFDSLQSLSKINSSNPKKEGESYVA